MSNKITNYVELRQSINELQAAKLNQEDLIKQNGRELIDILNPVNIIKKTISGLAHDAEVRQDALSAALNIGADFIIGKIFRSNKSVKGHVITEFLGRLSSNYLTGKMPAIKEFIYEKVSGFIDKRGKN